jgi:hypothetical protein
MSRGRRQGRRDIEWEFFTFPVAFAFACGALLATLLYPLGFFVFIISLFGVSFGMAHMFTHWWRRRTTDRRIAKEEEAERERRALAARAAAAQAGEAASPRRRRRRRP